MAKDPATVAHQKWVGYVQPVGLVVSVPAMLAANATLNQNIVPDHNRFLAALPINKDGGPTPDIPDFPAFAGAVLGWGAADLHGAPDSTALPPSLEAVLPDYNETLRPTYALREFQPSDPAKEWILLVQMLPKGSSFDAVAADDSRRWQASPQARFERLLRQTKVPVGLLVNQEAIRLVYAPDKELSGHITFKLAEMITVAGRPIFAALHMLLCSERLYSVAETERLPAILSSSRKYQNTVSTQLANQVVEALYELLRGFQAADDQLKGELLREVLKKDPDHVYHGLLTSLLRLVFVLYAEDRGLLPTDEVYGNHYSVTGLYERLRADDGRYHDNMYQRYGAWAQLLVLFRLVHRGGRHGALRIPAREGYLFDPNRYLFLEGRHEVKDHPAIPRVSDGVVFNVLSKLMLLDGERLSYRNLAVEQIGSVYQAIMGFSVQVAAGPSIAIRPAKKHGAPATINLEELLHTAPEKRLTWLDENTDQKLSGPAGDSLKSAATIDELLAALERKIAKTVTPNVVPKSAMVFQPSGERRKSGSHYTPSSLTGPIVEAALDPVLKRLGANPTPAQILNIKVCDPAMGSAAFLVEACRQLGDALTRAWHAHDEVPVIPLDEDESLYAQRLVAQRCLYGLDKNPMATDLAKLSLWLATLAKDHPFTFLDHSLRHGEALVGLSRKQIAAFNWAPAQQQTLLEERIRKLVDRVSQHRQRIFDARDNVPYTRLVHELTAAEDSLSLPRMIGDAVIAAFFSDEKPRLREETRKRFLMLLETDLKNHGMIPLGGEVDLAVKRLRSGTKSIPTFHWELEFPEVFTTEKATVTGGFDVIVGNPPFAGRNSLIQTNADNYLDWLKIRFPDSRANADLVAYFFRLSFLLVRSNGCFGLIATNTISQGESRFTALRWICLNGGTIYRAMKRLRWPGEAAVVVSVIHVTKGSYPTPYWLSGRLVNQITAYLFHSGGHEDPAELESDGIVVSEGTKIYSPGFTFDDTDKKGVATPCLVMQGLLSQNPFNSTRVFPYLGGEEVASHPTHQNHRYVINFEEMPLERSNLGKTWGDADDTQRKAWLAHGIVPNDYPNPVARDWPDLLKIVELKVKPYRLSQDDDQARRLWWRFQRVRRRLYEAMTNLAEIMVVNCGATPHLALAFVSARQVFAHSLVVFASDSKGLFATLQSRIHEIWARREASSMKDDLRYTHSACFNSFPLPKPSWDTEALTTTGGQYHQIRADIMTGNNEGMTQTYNRFHDPDETSVGIQHLRMLHDAIDRAVLEAFGWTDIQPTCAFFPEFDEEEVDDSGRPKKKKYRYRWPDDTRDEVLARLLDLNQQRALEEGQLLPVVANERVNEKKRKTKKSMPDLFSVDKGDV